MNRVNMFPSLDYDTVVIIVFLLSHLYEWFFPYIVNMWDGGCARFQRV